MVRTVCGDLYPINIALGSEQLTQGCEKGLYENNGLTEGVILTEFVMRVVFFGGCSNCRLPGDRSLVDDVGSQSPQQTTTKDGYGMKSDSCP